MHQIFVHITAFELGGLCEFWDHLNKRFFARLERSFMSSVRKLEYCLKRYYLVHAIQVFKKTPDTFFSLHTMCVLPGHRVHSDIDGWWRRLHPRAEIVVV